MNCFCKGRCGVLIIFSFSLEFSESGIACAIISTLHTLYHRCEQKTIFFEKNIRLLI